MWKFILIFLFSSSSIFSQDILIGKKDITVFEDGFFKKQTILNPLRYEGSSGSNLFQNSSTQTVQSNTFVRWSYTDPAAIGDYCQSSGNGRYSVVGWDLNNERISLYGNLNSTPLWEFMTDPEVFLNFVTVSDTGGVVGVASYHNIYLFTNMNNIPFFNFDLTQLPDTGIASAMDITNDGRFIVASVSNQDTSTVYGFNSSSNISVWKFIVVPTVTAGGASIQGVKISGNDSLVIVNTYAEFFVFKTYTGQMIFSGLINPATPNSGTQAVQGINGDGSVIATINYNGILRVYQWNGTTYNLLFQNQEPPGMFYNWYTSVDVTYDGNYIAAGTLNFISTSSYDGKIKVFNRSMGGTPLWQYTGCGDEVTALSFSGSGNILAGSSWGEFNNQSNDLYIFKTFSGNVPIFTLNTPGSFFYCNTSKDGRTVVVSGKAVHARQFGSGGLLYNIDVDTNDIPSSVISNSRPSESYRLYQNYPNPFNPVTKIQYSLPGFDGKAQHTILRVYDLTGKEVATLVNESQSAGSYEVEFNASGFSSGLYYYRIVSGDFIETKKMILLK